MRSKFIPKKSLPKGQLYSTMLSLLWVSQLKELSGLIMSLNKVFLLMKSWSW